MNPEPPLPTAPAPRPGSSRFAGFLILSLAVSSLAAAVVYYGLFGMIRLDRNVRGLRDALLTAEPNRWTTQFEVNLGPVTTSLVRFGSNFAPLDREAHAVIHAFQWAEVGVYSLDHGRAPLNRAALLEKADTAMARRGWQRCVATVNSDAFVAVYVPRNDSSTRRLEVCVAVIADRKMVIGSTCANTAPLLALAENKLPGFHRHHF